VRFAAQDPSLGGVVRERQDLSARWRALDNALMAAVSRPVTEGESSAERIRQQMQNVDARIKAMDQRLKKDFPEYFSLVRPEPVTVSDLKNILQSDEVLVQFSFDGPDGFIWAITKADTPVWV
jgi:hypothetical protein